MNKGQSTVEYLIIYAILCSLFLVGIPRIAKAYVNSLPSIELDITCQGINKGKNQHRNRNRNQVKKQGKK